MGKVERLRLWTVFGSCYLFELPLLAHFGGRSLGRDLATLAGGQEGGHLFLLDIISQVSRRLPVGVLGGQVDLALRQKLGKLTETVGGGAV